MVDAWQVQELRDREQVANNRIADLQAMLTTCRRDIERLEQLLEEWTIDYNLKEAALADCRLLKNGEQSRREHFEAECESLREQLADAEAECDQLRQQLAEARGEVKP